MKTKYDSIVKIRKKEVDKIESNIQKINSSIKMLNNKISLLKEEINSLILPLQGTFATFSQINFQKNLFLNEINNLKNQIIILENRKKELLKELKKANMEYEKMKYLKNEEIKKIIKKIKIKENIEMDEIAIFTRKKNG